MKKLQSEQEFYKSLGRQMRKLRKRTKLSPYYMGRAIGTNGILYNEMKMGRIPPTPYQLYRIIHMCNAEILKDWQ